MKSIGAKIEQLTGLLDTKDLTDWEHQFVSDIAARTGDGKRTSMLSERQVESVDRIYGKHFA